MRREKETGPKSATHTDTPHNDPKILIGDFYTKNGRPDTTPAWFFANTAIIIRFLYNTALGTLPGRKSHFLPKIKIYLRTHYMLNLPYIMDYLRNRLKWHFVGEKRPFFGEKRPLVGKKIMEIERNFFL